MENPWKVIAAFIGVFVAGAVFGGFFSIGIGARWMATQAALTQAVQTAPAPVASAPATPAPAPKPVAQPAQHPPLLQVPQTWQAPMLMRRYAERLDLTPEQKERIIPLFQRATEDYRRVQQNTFRETAIILQRLAQDLEKELTPEQREKLLQWQEKQREEVLQLEQRNRELQQKKKNGQKPVAAPPKAPAAAPSPGQPTAPATTSPATTAGSSTTATPSNVPAAHTPETPAKAGGESASTSSVGTESPKP